MGFATILGGALSGLGKGMAQQAEMDWNARREAALERLRADRGAALESQRHTNAVAEEELKSANKRINDSADNRERADAAVKLARVQGGIQGERDKKQHGYRMEVERFTATSAQQLARLNSQLTEGRTRAEVLLRNRLEAGEIDGNPVMGNDGNYWIKKKGSEQYENSGVRFATTAEKKGEDATTSWRSRSANTAGAASAPAPPSTSNTFTRAEATEAAKARNIPVETAIRMLQQAGGKMVD